MKLRVPPGRRGYGFSLCGLPFRAARAPLRYARSSSANGAEPITPADGGLADLLTVCCVLVVMGFRAAAEFQRSDA